MDILILFLFVIEIFILIKVDRILFGTFLTPISALSIPYIIIVFLTYLVGPSFGFVEFYYKSILFWMLGLFVFWLPGVLIAIFAIRKTNIYSYPFNFQQTSKSKPTLFLSYIVIIILILSVIKSMQSGKIGSPSFQQSFGTGISGHVLLLSRLLYIYLIIDYSRKNIVPIFLFLVLYLLYGAKSWILIPTIAGIFARLIIYKKNIQISLIIKIVVSGLILFYLSYRIVLGPNMPFSFAYKHFFTYLFSGTLGWSEYIRQNGEMGIDNLMLINPLVNIYSKISGIKLQSISSDVFTYIGSDAYPNVKTFFGTIFMYAGIKLGIIYIFICGIVTYLFLTLTIKTGDKMMLALYMLYLSALIFAWFDLYFNNLFFLEVPFIGIIFYLIYSTAHKFRAKKN